MRDFDGIGGFHENLLTLRYPKLPDFEWAQKMCLSFLDEIQSFLDEIQKVASLGTFIQKGNGGKTAQIRPSPNQNRSESQCSCIFQEHVSRGKYAYVGSGCKSKTCCRNICNKLIERNPPPSGGFSIFYVP